MYNASNPKLSAKRKDTMSKTPGATTSPGWFKRARKAEVFRFMGQEKVEGV
jgi:hypothetical protein